MFWVSSQAKKETYVLRVRRGSMLISFSIVSGLIVVTTHLQNIQYWCYNKNTLVAANLLSKQISILSEFVFNQIY